MVVEYLEKSKLEMLEQRATLLDETNSLEIKCKENIRLIQMLDETNDDNFESFSPREVSSYNKSKMHELEEEQKEIEQKLQEIRTTISELDMKVDEINSVIKVAQNDNTLSSEEVSKNKRTNMLVLESVEKERQRIARDLHDSTVQSLTSLVHKTELCMKLMDADPIRCRLELSAMGKMIREVIDDARQMIYNLRPMSFDDIGFDVTVERALDKFKTANNVRYKLQIEGDTYQLPNIISLTLLRIIQESCSNAIKHGKAELISVKLVYDAEQLVLTIENDGEGFDVSSIPETTRNDNSGFGLSMMKERVYLLSGNLDIQSEPGKNGCLITVTLPIKKEDL